LFPISSIPFLLFLSSQMSLRGFPTVSIHHVPGLPAHRPRTRHVPAPHSHLYMHVVRVGCGRIACSQETIQRQVRGWWNRMEDKEKTGRQVVGQVHRLPVQSITTGE
jgi:hypothetical protein